MDSDKIQLSRHVHFKKSLEDVEDACELVEDTGKYTNKAMAFIETNYFTEKYTDVS